MAQRMVIFGGTGFVGRYVARAALGAGWDARVASRSGSPIEGAEGIACNITSDADVAKAMADCHAAVNCVGILAPRGQNTFENLQAQGAERIARIAAELSLANMVHISAIGADPSSPSVYQRTKAAGEAGVLRHMRNALILRPSIVFGPEDSFFNRFADMSKLSPFVPVVGASTRFQPVYVGDVAAAVIAGLDQGKSGIHELGGPEVETFSALMERMLGVLGRKRLVLPLPSSVGMLMGTSFEILAKVTGIEPQITRDQVKNLGADNVVSTEYPGLAELGVMPTPMAEILPSYLK
ncbi:MAG: complex I NDUFA9 subunit family protein [Pseudomonadota bacterium]